MTGYKQELKSNIDISRHVSMSVNVINENVKVIASATVGMINLNHRFLQVPTGIQFSQMPHGYLVLVAQMQDWILQLQ